MVSENKLYSLDINNKVIEGELAENYILTKTILEPNLDVNEGYTVHKFTGNDKKEYNIVFNTNPKIPTALIKTDGLLKILSQTKSWAKGAEYEGSNTKLSVQGEKATITISGKKIELKEKK